MFKHQWSQWSLALLLGCSSGAIIFSDAIAPQVVSAYPQTVEIYVTRQTTETYQNLLDRSAIIARAATQRTLDSDILVTTVSVTILAENKGLIAPLLTLEVSRDQWWEMPDPNAWISYYDGVEDLLQFEAFKP